MSERDAILLVEDDEALGAQIVEQLEDAGYAVSWRKDGDAAAREDPAAFRLLILDLMLPGTYGLDLLKRYRRASDVPVMILSARQDTADKVRALELGADDYLTKPFWPQELRARVSARLRRPDIRREGDPIALDAITIDPVKRQVLVDGEVTPELTKVELDLLLTLAKRPGSAMTRAALVEAALDPERMGGERTLDVHVSRLRKKLGRAGKQVATVWGIGYRLDETTPTP